MCRADNFAINIVEVSGLSEALNALEEIIKVDQTICFVIISGAVHYPVKYSVHLIGLTNVQRSALFE